MFRAAAGRRGLQSKRRRALRRRRVRPASVEVLIRRHRELLEELSPRQISRLREQFSKHDPDGLGFILAKNIEEVLKGLGDRPKPEDLESLMKLVDADGNDLIDFEEFMTLIAVRSQHQYAAEDVVSAFETFDPSGTGLISVDVLQRAMRELLHIPEERIKSFVWEATDGDEDAGEIDYRAFVTKLMAL